MQYQRWQSFTDQFDLKPGGRGFAFDAATTDLGGVYHGAMGNSGPEVSAEWTKKY